MSRNPCIIRHNHLDTVFFNDLYESSMLLKELHESVVRTVPDCSSLLEDLYYLLYKKVLLLEKPVPETVHGFLLEDISRQSGLAKLRTRTAGNRTETHIALWVLTQDLLERLRGSQWLQEALHLLQTLQDTVQSQETAGSPDTPTESPSWEQDFWKGVLPPKAAEALSRIAAAIHGESGLAEQIDTLEELDQEISQKTNEDGSQNPSPRGLRLKEALADAAASETPFESFMVAAAEAYSSPQENEHGTPVDSNVGSASPPESPGEKSPESAETDTPPGESDSVSEALKNAAKEGRERFSKITEGTWRGQESSFQLPSQDGTDIRRILVDGAPDKTRAPIAEGIDSSTSENTASGKSALKISAALSPGPSTGPGILSQKEFILHKVRKALDHLNAASLFDHAAGQLDTLQDTLSHIGTTPQEMDTLPYDEVLRLYKRTLDHQMIRFFNKVGQKREIARMAQHRKKARRDLPIDKIRPDDDLDSMIDDELMDLAIGIEAFENSFIDRFLHKSLLTQSRVTRSARHKGPIILCYDGSGSMEGEKIMETKAHILAFIEVARRQKRRLITIQFASASEPLFIREIHPRHVQFQEVLELMDTFLKGGTDFERPLKEALQYLETDHFRNGDILFITDGICDISETFKRRFMASKAEKKFHLYAVIIHGNTYEDYGDLSDIADEILEIRQRDLSDWNQRISEKIFSI